MTVMAVKSMEESDDREPKMSVKVWVADPLFSDRFGESEIWETLRKRFGADEFHFLDV